MLIEFLFERFPNWEDVTETAVGDLQVRRDILEAPLVINMFTFYSILTEVPLL